MINFVGKCLFIEEDEKRILVVGDLHLGYEEYMNRTGVLISRQMFEEMIKYFDRIFFKIGNVDEIVLLGDIKHNFGSIMKQEWEDVIALFDYFKKKCKKIVVVKGNHDNILKPIVEQRDMVRLVKNYTIGEYYFMHGDKKLEKTQRDKIKNLILGHGHPAIKISDGIKTEKYKCFLVGSWENKKVIVVPSFFEGNVGSDPRENELGLAENFNLNDFDVLVVEEERLEVLNFGKLKKV